MTQADKFYQNCQRTSMDLVTMIDRINANQVPCESDRDGNTIYTFEDKSTFKVLSDQITFYVNNKGGVSY